MRKLLIAILCICACVCVTACGNKGSENSSSENVSSQNGVELPEDKFD